MKAIIIDDERLARQELLRLLKNFPEIKILAESHNAEHAKKKIEQLKPDLIFLDIQMPGKNGFDLLEDLDFIPQVIFTTAYDEYALKAFEVNALDYLLKPIEEARLETCINKIRLRIESKKDVSDSEAEFKSREEYLGVDDQVFVKDGERCWFVKLNQIGVFESEGNYVKVYFDKFKPLILKSLNSLEERLDPTVFFRANRKFIINLEWVESIESWFNGGLKVVLKDGKEVEISRRQATKFKELKSL